MLKLTILAYSASKKSVLASVTKACGIFQSEICVGAIKVDTATLPAIGSVHELPGITSASIRQSIAEDGAAFDWLVLS